MIRRRRPLQRHEDPAIARALLDRGLHPVLCRLLASRGARDAAELDMALAGLAAPDALADGWRAAELLAGAIDAGERICVVADYDCDGATACAVAVRGLRRFGARIDYLVPNRFTHGYGLSPAVVALARSHPRLGEPQWLVTVDNGIASVEGVEAAHRAGMKVIVTDHHLPGPVLPAAEAIVNPNRVDCGFPSKHLAGVGVVFYLLGLLRAQRRARGDASVDLVDLLDLVAVGTIADVVRLDANNRRLVAAGMRRIRAGLASPGVAALLAVAGVDPARATVRDIGYGVAPRINAAGRLAEISTGIECLLTEDPGQAARLAGELDAINRERRRIEQDMRAQALAEIGAPDAARAPVLVVCRDDWHEGVVGLVAGRLKDRHWRPVIALAPARGEPGMLRGSGRSIPGLHLRDALETVANRHPGMVARYGGHAMAAGLSLPAANLPAFAAALREAVLELADDHAFDETLLHDGPLAPSDLDLALLDAIESGIWGQGFPPPTFVNEFHVERQRIVGEAHLKLSLRLGDRAFDGIAFGRTDPLHARALLAYRPERNAWQGRESIQLVIEDVLEPHPPI